MTKSAKEKVNHYIDQCSKRLIHIKVKNEFFVEQNGIHVPNMSFLSANSSHVMLYRFEVNWVRS